MHVVLLLCTHIVLTLHACSTITVHARSASAVHAHSANTVHTHSVHTHSASTVHTHSATLCMHGSITCGTARSFVDTVTHIIEQLSPHMLACAARSTIYCAPHIASTVQHDSRLTLCAHTYCYTVLARIHSVPAHSAKPARTRYINLGART